MIRILITTITLLMAFYGMTNSVDDVLIKLKSKYSNVQLIEYNTLYELYKGHTSTNIAESYKGYVYRQGNLMYQKINTTEFIYGNDYSLKINSDEKAMILSPKQNSLDKEFDIETTLKHCKEKKMSEDNSNYIITLVLKSTSEIPFSVVKLRVKKAEYSLQQIDLYYSDYIDFSTDFRKKDLQQAHLKIKFSDITFTPVKRTDRFKLENYIIIKKDYLTPSSKYNGYELIDNRI